MVNYLNGDYKSLDYAFQLEIGTIKNNNIKQLYSFPL